MSLDFNSIIKTLMESKKIIALVEELKLTPEEIRAFLPALLTIVEEEQEETNEYSTTLTREQDGTIHVVKELSEIGKKHAFIENVKTTNYYPIDFDLEKNFESLPERAPILNAFKKFVSVTSEKKGFYIFGPTGVGKTFILKRLAKRLAENGYTIGFMPVQEIVSTVKENFEAKQEVVNILKNVDVLFLDDIGTETISQWFRDEILFSILSFRNMTKKPMFFSSTFSLQKLEEMESRTTGVRFRDIDKAKRLIAQIKNACHVFNLEGKSWNM